MIRKIVAFLCIITMMVTGFSFMPGTILGNQSVENGTDVMPDNLKWKSFSICTREDGGVWEDSLKQLYRTLKDGSYFLDENGQKVHWTKGEDYWTEGYIPDGYTNDSRNVDFLSVSSGWDGEYAQEYPNGPIVLSGDNPWGMTLYEEGIPVEYGRYYTMEFDIAGDLRGKNYDGITGKTNYVPADKHILFKVYDYNSQSEPSAVFENVKQDGEEMSRDGYIRVNKKEEGEENRYSHIVAKFLIPEDTDDWGGGKNEGIFTHMGIKFALGANLMSYPYEESMSGFIYIKNMKVLAGKKLSEEDPGGIEGEDNHINGIGNDGKLLWSDEFDGDSLDETKWNYDFGAGGWGNRELQYYRPENNIVKDGKLAIKSEFQYDEDSEQCVPNSYYSGRINSKGKINVKYGNIQMRAKLPKGQGTFSSGWMLGHKEVWPKCGEIDLFGFNNQSDKCDIVQSLHCKRFNGLAGSLSGKQWNTTIDTATSEYHTYGIKWTPKKIVFTIDGVETGTYNPSTYVFDGDGTDNVNIWPFKQPFYFVLNTSIGGVLGGRTTPKNWTRVSQEGDISKYQDYMYVDWVRVYETPEKEEAVKPDSNNKTPTINPNNKKQQNIVLKVKNKKIKKTVLKKKKKTFKKVIRIKDAFGTVKYSKLKKSSKRLSINKKTGAITVKKGTKKGTYKLRVLVSLSGNDNYLPASKTVTVKVKVY